MKIERTRNATRNIIYGTIAKIYQLLVPFAVRTAMIYVLGAEYLGLGSLFTSILSVLNLTELGVGSAMVFSMYKPIAEDDTPRICALMSLYRKYYRIIGSVILVVGIVITPLIPKLVKGDVPDGISLIVLYWLNLGATVLTYFLFAYKNSLLSAHQRLDIGNKISMIIMTLQYALQIGAIFLKNYYLYVIVALFTTALNNIVTAVIVDKMYPEYKPVGKLDKKEIKIINRRIRDLFTAKIGGVVVDSADSIVISAFLGLTVLAMYNNYFYIMSSILGFIGILFSSCTTGIGNSIIIESDEKNYNDLKKFLLIISWIAGVCTCCLLCLFQPFMKIWVGEKYMLSMPMVICMCCYFFLHEINRLINTYKDAAGMWHEDRWRPLVVSITNLGLNLLMVQYIGLFGILLSTVISMLFVGMPWLLYNLFTVIFHRNAFGFILRTLWYVVVTVISCVIFYWLCSYITIDGVIGFIVKGIVVFVGANFVFLVSTFKLQEFTQTKEMALKIVKRK